MGDESGRNLVLGVLWVCCLWVVQEEMLRPDVRVGVGMQTATPGPRQRLEHSEQVEGPLEAV